MGPEGPNGAGEPRSRLAVSAACLVRGGRLLGARRREGGPRGGLWELPGGKVEPGETPQQALARELAEELGIRVEVQDLLCEITQDYADLRILLSVYRCGLMTGEPTALEHGELRWFLPEELAQVHWCAADAKALERVRGTLLFRR